MTGINPYSLTGIPNLGGGTSQVSVQSSQITTLPHSLSNLTQATTLKGQVSGQNPDGTTIIQTQQGSITVKLQTALPLNTHIDLQIPAGQPPKEALIQPSLTRYLQQRPPAHNNKGEQPSSSQTTATPSPRDDTTSTAPLTKNTSYQDVKSLQGTAQQASKTIGGTPNNPAILTTGQTVRLSPLPADQQTNNYIQSHFKPVVEALSLTKLAQFKFLSLALNTVIKSSTSLPQTLSIALSSLRNNPAPSSHHGTITTSQSHEINIGLKILPPNLKFNLSSDRTIRPIKAELSPTTTTTGGMSKPITAPLPHDLTSLPSMRQQPSSSPAPLPQAHDMRVLTITTPPHIIPPSIPAVSIGNQAADILLLTIFAGQSSAIATGFLTPDGSPILQLLNTNGQAQMMSLHYPASNLSAGTQLSFASLPHAAQSITQNANIGQSMSWPAMQNLIDELAATMSQVQFQSLINLIPSPTNTQQFPAAALLFLVAAKGGDLGAWLGPKHSKAIDSAQSPTINGKNTLQKLLGDLSNSGTGKTATPSDPPQVQASPDWRGHTIPLMVGADIHAATLWTKSNDQHGQGSGNKNPSGTRFLVDLHLSRMGNVQFDGLIHPDKKSLHLAFATQHPLSHRMQDMLKSIWYKTMDGLGYNGQITFKDIS